MASAFEKQIKAWAEDTRVDLRKGARQATYGLFEALSDNTPVRTGFLRGSWQVNLNNATPEEGDYDPSGTMSKSAALSSLQQYSLGDTIYIMNSAHYARFVEYGSAKFNVPFTGRLFATTVLQNARSIGEAAIRGL